MSWFLSPSRVNCLKKRKQKKLLIIKWKSYKIRFFFSPSHHKLLLIGTITRKKFIILNIEYAKCCQISNITKGTKTGRTKQRKVTIHNRNYPYCLLQAYCVCRWVFFFIYIFFIRFNFSSFCFVFFSFPFLLLLLLNTRKGCQLIVNLFFFFSILTFSHLDGITCQVNMLPNKL